MFVKRLIGVSFQGVFPELINIDKSNIFFKEKPGWRKWQTQGT